MTNHIRKYIKTTNGRLQLHIDNRPSRPVVDITREPYRKPAPRKPAR